MTGPAARAAVDAFWARRLGCRVADLHLPGVVVAARPAPSVLAWLRAATMVIAVPADRQTALAGALRGLAPAEAFQPERLRALFEDAAKVVGPAYQGFADASDLRAVPTGGVRPLGPADRAALEGLRQAAGETAWEHSAIDPDRPPVFGRFAGGVLVAAATLEGAGEPVASVGVLTRPGHKGRGHGRAVAGAAALAALEGGTVAHYQTLDANAASVAVARALGFRRDATTVAVRLGRT